MAKVTVKNVSARLHHVGEVSIAPGETAEIDSEWAEARNKDDLPEAKADKKADKKAAEKDAAEAEKAAAAEKEAAEKEAAKAAKK